MMRSRTYLIKTEGDIEVLNTLLFKALVSLNNRVEPIRLDVSGKNSLVPGYRKFIVEEHGSGELIKEHLVLGGTVIDKKFIITIKYKHSKGWGWSDVFEVFFKKVKKGIRITISRINGLGRTTPGYIIEIIKTLITEENYEYIFEVTVYE